MTRIRLFELQLNKKQRLLAEKAGGLIFYKRNLINKKRKIHICF